MNIPYLAIFYSSLCSYIHIHAHTVHIHWHADISQIHIQGLALSSIQYYATACSTKTRSGRWHCQAAVTVAPGPGGSLTSSWPGGRGVCKPVTVTVEW